MQDAKYFYSEPVIFRMPDAALLRISVQGARVSLWFLQNKFQVALDAFIF